MENNLYYTPTIEEFHVGFEFEKYDDRVAIYSNYPKECTTTNWHRFKYDLRSIRLSQLGTHLYSKTIRVKYLDQSDIESLGLNGFEITEYVEESHLEFTWFKGIELFGLLTFTDKMISFYEYNYSTREYSDCIFRGTIKNKSELIKLMQQLNIK